MRGGMLMRLWIVIAGYIAFWVGVVAAIIVIGSQHSHAQVPPTIVQTTYGYPAAFILFWQVGSTPPPPCGQTLPSGAPGPVLYSMAIQQGPPDTVMVCLNGTGGSPEWVPLVTAP
jgi:hypothetical protein